MKSPLYVVPLLLGLTLVVGGCTADATRMSTPEPVGTFARTFPDVQVDGAVGLSMAGEPSAGGRDSGGPIESLLTGWGADVDVAYASGDARTQEAQIDDMIDAGVEVLLVQPADEYGLGEVLQRAAEAGVSVVAYDRLIWNTPDTDFYVGFDNFQTAIDVANATLAGLGVGSLDGATATVPDEPYAIEVFAGAPGDAFFGFGYNGMVKKILAFALADGRIRYPEGDPTPELAATDVSETEAIAKRLEEIYPVLDAGAPVGVAAIDDEIAHAVIEELRSHGYSPDGSWPIVVGAGGTVDAIRAVRDGEQFATVLQDERVLHETAAAVVAALLSGQFPENLVVKGHGYNNDAELVPTFLVAPTVVTQENLDATIFGTGYLSPEEVDG